MAETVWRDRRKSERRNNMSNEKTLNVKLDEKTRQKLDARAEDNGRAACREAAAIIKKAVR